MAKRKPKTEPVVPDAPTVANQPNILAFLNFAVLDNGALDLRVYWDNEDNSDQCADSLAGLIFEVCSGSFSQDIFSIIVEKCKQSPELEEFCLMTLALWKERVKKGKESTQSKTIKPSEVFAGLKRIVNE